VKIGYFQFSPERGELSRNIKTVRRRLAGTSCDIIVLPELFNTGYLFSSIDEAAALSEEIPKGATTQALSEMAASSDVAIVGGIAERDGDHLYNSSVLVRSDGEIFIYRKLHLFGFEKDVFSPGNREPEVFDVCGVKIGMMICFDWYFPETARILMLKGAQILCHPANLVLPYCQVAMPTRCLENRVFAITANRIGSESVGDRELTFTGRSMIIDPLGRVLAEAPVGESCFECVDIDPQVACDKRLTSRNNLLSDRRAELYGELTVG